MGDPKPLWGPLGPDSSLGQLLSGIGVGEEASVTTPGHIGKSGEPHPGGDAILYRRFVNGRIYPVDKVDNI